MATQKASSTGAKGPRRVAVFIQEKCFNHRYIRSKDNSSIVERPERLRAVSVGLAAAIARLEESTRHDRSNASISSTTHQEQTADDLETAMARMDIKPQLSKSPVSIIQSQSSIDLMKHPAVKFIHGDVDGDVYLENLNSWSKESWEKISMGESEIPEGLPQGDLYLCPESIDAIQGALGAMCDAIDTVVASSNGTAQGQASRAFVAIRPPGHHCGEDTPCGFCFVNNVAIGAAHAHLQHNMKRIVIMDIDLHHGNGTQSIAWQINEETYRQTLESEGAPPPTKPGPQIFYGSIHDILSFPCEDGKPDFVQAASVSIHNAHGQHIENVHLETYTSEEHFWNVLYKEQYSRILRKAEAFLDSTGGPGDDVIVFISCGMDACEHEYPSMSRHNRKVPTSFYHRFTRDACAFSDQHASGRLVSVLEGGYSDRALISGSMAHLVGLVGGEFDESWWGVENLDKLEKATKKRRGGRRSMTAAPEDTWLERTLELLPTLDSSPAILPRAVPAAPTSRTLRDRKKPPSGAPPISSTKGGSPKSKRGNSPNRIVPQCSRPAGGVSPTESGSTDEDRHLPVVEKKLPRVVLRLGPPPNGP
ncbi:histone deacetylase complex protein [Infundibulicybe gibba]|nr:histone deacetylase complex protein [Infundibulicybe gibba]